MKAEQKIRDETQLSISNKMIAYWESRKEHYERAVERGRCDECDEPLAFGECETCEDCLCPE